MLVGLLVFLAAAAYDYAIARYVVAVDLGNGHLAARWSVATYLVGLVGTLGVIKLSMLLIFPEIAGLYTGTLLAVSKRS